MIFKCLAAAGLAASLATGGAIAVHSPAADHAPAVTVSAGTVTDDHPEVNDETTTSTTIRPTMSTTAPTTAPAPVVTDHTAGDAGTVTLSVSGGMVTVTAVAPNAGWTVETERSAGHEAEVSFRNGLRRIDFKAEFEDGRLQTRVTDRTTEADHDQPAVSPPPPAADNDDDQVAGDDNGRPEVESEQRDDDHSGPGRDGSGSDDRSGRDGGDDGH